MGARLQHFLLNWQAITDDPWILKTIRGYSLELTSTPGQHRPAPPIALNQEKSAALTAEIDKLLQKQAISQVEASPGEFLSPVFLVPKADGSWCLVINLQNLNSHIAQHHFKMEGIRTVKGLMRKGDSLTKLDLKDTYLSVPMNQLHTHLLRVQWQSQIYQFDTLPFGLSSAPYVFTKLLKPVVAILKKVGNQGCSLLRQHADHGKLQGGSPSPPSNSNASLDSSGIYPQPQQECSNTHSESDFLGVLPGFTYHADLLTNSQDSVHTTPDQRDPSPRRSRGNHSQVIPTAGLNGIHSSSSSSSPTALPPLGESQDNGTKTQSQLQHCSDNMRQDLTCRWLQELPRHSSRLMQWDMVIESDASTLGWGASLTNTSTGRSWTPQERSRHINYLELLAAFLALKTFVTNTHNKAILLRLDNVTAIAFLNRMGGHIQRHFAIWQYTFGNGAWRGIYSSMQNTSPGS